jgi:hypothetical protein
MNNLNAGFSNFTTGKSKSKNEMEKGFIQQSPAFEVFRIN